MVLKRLNELQKKMYNKLKKYRNINIHFCSYLYHHKFLHLQIQDWRLRIEICSKWGGGGVKSNIYNYDIWITKFWNTEASLYGIWQLWQGLSSKVHTDCSQVKLTVKDRLLSQVEWGYEKIFNYNKIYRISSYRGIIVQCFPRTLTGCNKMTYNERISIAVLGKGDEANG